MDCGGNPTRHCHCARAVVITDLKTTRRKQQSAELNRSTGNGGIQARQVDATGIQVDVVVAIHGNLRSQQGNRPLQLNLRGAACVSECE